MNELALFAGAGGGILGGLLAGFRTVCAVEIEPYPASSLCQRQNDKLLPPFPIWDDVRTFDGKPWRGIVDVVSGGFPCQDISCAGKGAGITGARSGLWKEFARIIGEVRPRFVFVENSPFITKRGLHVVLGDLAKMRYDAEWECISAKQCGANHERNRFWLVGFDPTKCMPIESENPTSRIRILQSGRPRKLSKKGQDGSLNWAQLMLHKGYLPTATLCEYYMGWPIGWTDLHPLETGRFQQWLNLHGASCAEELG